jgi:hypothetical protein
MGAGRRNIGSWTSGRPCAVEPSSDMLLSISRPASPSAMGFGAGRAGSEVEVEEEEDPCQRRDEKSSIVAAERSSHRHDSADKATTSSQ